MVAIISAVSRSKGHTFSKPNAPMIRLIAGLGVEGDAHMGEKVKHRYRALKYRDAPNRRQYISCTKNCSTNYARAVCMRSLARSAKM